MAIDSFDQGMVLIKFTSKPYKNLLKVSNTPIFWMKSSKATEKGLITFKHCFIIVSNPVCLNI